jgi:enoyl-CoA hydratase/carnithine racemase
MTKQMLESEHTMSLAEAIEAEAQAQALCMQHPDFAEAHAAFKAKRPPKFRGAPDEG